MAILKIEKTDTDHQPITYELPKIAGVKANIGVDAQNDIVLQDTGVAPYHGFIVRASNGFYSLLNYDATPITVNELEIPGLRILRHKDVVRMGLGSYKITYYDVSKFIVDENSNIVGVSCLFCQDRFLVGSEVVMCPKCDTVYHVSCWKIIHNQACLLPNCGYFIDKFEEWQYSMHDETFDISVNDFIEDRLF